MTNIPLIERFVAAWNRLDMDEIESMLTTDIFYHNVPMEPSHGIDQFRETIAQFPMENADWTIHAIAENGNKVLTERTDRFTMGGKPLTIRVMGIFEIEDGKIAQWRDYFDLAEMTQQLA